MTKTHTPGPWAVHPFYPRDVQAGGVEIATAFADYQQGKEIRLGGQIDATEAEALANARLIAAAPELLDALEACVSELTELYGEVLPDTKAEGRERVESDPVLVLARAAIAKARGEA